MDRQFYLDLAAAGLRMPIGVHLILHENDAVEATLKSGTKLGNVVVEAARRFNTPLAIPLMDLSIEKACMLEILGIAKGEIPAFHFKTCPGSDDAKRLDDGLEAHINARLEATVEAIAHVKTVEDLIPVGMAIGPFSLMVNMVKDPIKAVFKAGKGSKTENEPSIKTLQWVLEMGTRVIEWSVKKQLAAGAKAVVICEPAAGTAYISPRQMAKGSDIFERYVMHFNRRIKAVLDEANADLFFHCCGELTDPILSGFTQLDPAVLSLGSSRCLWEDASIVPKTTVLYGNLPSKKFFSDAEITEKQLEKMALNLIQKMKHANHPFILGTECDVLSVKGSEEIIKGKVRAFINAGCCG